MRGAFILLSVLAACSAGGDLPRTSELGIGLTFPDGFDAEVSEVRLEIFDELAACSGDERVGGSLLQSEALEPGIPSTIQVSSGTRFFHALGFELDLLVAQGCARAVLGDGEETELQIDMVDATPAFGAVDESS